MRATVTRFLAGLTFLIVTANYVHAQVTSPQIKSARFDAQGKLVVRAQVDAIAGCYVAINGGLAAKKIETGITSLQLTSKQAQDGTVTIRTRRRYFCKKRTLYVNAELVCLNELIGSATSPARAVQVPESNLTNQ